MRVLLEGTFPNGSVNLYKMTKLFLQAWQNNRTDLIERVPLLQLINDKYEEVGN